jgi:hypothetical protein
MGNHPEALGGGLVTPKWQKISLPLLPWFYT